MYECGGKRESREGGERERHPDLEIIMALISKTAVSNPPMYMSKGKSHSSWFLVPALESPVGRHWASYYSESAPGLRAQVPQQRRSRFDS